MVYYAMPRKKKRKITNSITAFFNAFCHLFKSTVFVSWAVAIIGLITLTAMSVPKLRATHIPAADLRVSFNNPPIWLDDSVLRELETIARITLAKSTLSREILIETADTLAATGWFREIKQLQWVSDNEVIVRASFLIPYAKVQDANGEVYIDVYGQRLPTRRGTIVKPQYHFITLKNPSFDRPQRPGLQWSGEDISSGLNLLKLIYDKPWAIQVEAIDLSQWITNKSLVLETATPSYLLWGSAPGKERGLEALANNKIDRLNHIYSKYGRIDQNISAEFDLTNTARVTRN
jgi:hypothetical protein